MRERIEINGKRITVLLLLATAMALPSQANPFDSIRNFFVKEHGADTLIVTGNYVRPRLLCELIQRKTKEPALLVSGNGNSRVFYLSVDREEPLEIKKESYVEFIQLLNPRRLVVLGNSEVVPSRIVDVLNDRFPTITIAGTNWGVNAEAAANLFDYKKLPNHYSYYFRTGIDSIVKPDAEQGGEPQQPSRQSDLPSSLRSGKQRPSSDNRPATPMQPPVIQPIN
ncbi:MAG: hypothetical protein ACOCUY_00720 [Verrucomicrobiota bacterium]